ncbi:hypothetical protein, partial [Mycobacterium sp.]|uniref:hypothetical protein n=1 Tax=Mycobacterium sp. TaxID=1785 RepID=UPI003C740828
MSAVAAVAVASPFAVTAVTALTASPQPAPEKHDFVQAAMVTDLPGEIVSALQSSLSQFGIVVPNVPSGILGPASTPASSALPSPGGFTATPGSLTAPGLTATAPGLTATPTPGFTALPTTPPVTSPASVLGELANPGLSPGTAALTAPSVTATPPGLITPPAGIDPVMTSPLGAAPSLTGVQGEVPIGAPLGPDGLAGYPVMGDPLTAMPSTAPASGGLLSELSSAAEQLGASQAIDLLKGVVVPSIMQAIKSAAPAAEAAPAAAVPA